MFGISLKRSKVTPEAVAADQLASARMALFTAEQALQTALTEVEHYRKRVVYLETIAKQGGMEQWVDTRTEALRQVASAQVAPAPAFTSAAEKAQSIEERAAAMIRTRPIQPAPVQEGEPLSRGTLAPV